MSPERTHLPGRRTAALTAALFGLIAFAPSAWPAEHPPAADVRAAPVTSAAAIPAPEHATPEPAATHVPAAPAPATHAPKAHASSHGARAGGGRGSAVVALANLMVGNERFVAGRASHPHQGAATRRALVQGQHPAAVVLACADSRVPPELIFDQGLGDLFVVRVAGNTLDAAAVASIEYAVEHLGSSLVVVLGHHACGAVKTALTVEPAAAGSPDLSALLSDIRPRVERFIPGFVTDPTLDAPVRANVDAVCAELQRRSAIVRASLASDRMALIPAVYALESGRVDFWGGSTPPAEPCAQTAPAPVPEPSARPTAGIEETPTEHP